jgi:hypothetical protein
MPLLTYECLVRRLINNVVPTAEIIWGKALLESNYVA